MNLPPGFLSELFATSAVSAVLLAVLGFLFRSQITHWLARGLEAEKARHQRELEAYKNSLIADAEKTKALQEVKKAAAIRIAELQFAAIDRYHRAFLAARFDIPSTARLSAEHKLQAAWEKTNAVYRELRDAEHGWDIFLSREEKAVLLEYRDALQRRCIQHAMPGSAPIADADWPAVQNELLALTIDVEALLKNKLEAMQQQQ